MSTANRKTLEEAIKSAIESHGGSVAAFARESGVSQPVLQRFLSGQRGLTLATADRLCNFLGLELRQRRNEKTPKSR